MGATLTKREDSSGTQKIKRTYGAWARYRLYNLATSLTLLGNEKKIRKQSVAMLNLHRGDRVIDIACGTGKNHPYLVEAVGPTGSVVGVDITPEILDRAREQVATQGWENMTLLETDASDLNLPEQSFDGVICTLGFSVMQRYREAIRKAFSLLKEEGRIVVCDASPLRGMYRILNCIVVPLYRRAACWDPHKDVLGTLETCMADLNVQSFNGGSIFIVAGKRVQNQESRIRCKIA